MISTDVYWFALILCTDVHWWCVLMYFSQKRPLLLCNYCMFLSDLDQAAFVLQFWPHPASQASTASQASIASTASKCRKSKQNNQTNLIQNTSKNVSQKRHLLLCNYCIFLSDLDQAAFVLQFWPHLASQASTASPASTARLLSKSCCICIAITRSSTSGIEKTKKYKMRYTNI